MYFASELIAYRLPVEIVVLCRRINSKNAGNLFKTRPTTIEIISTDAEGRLILADALCYAGTLNPTTVIDVATLTGGKVIALGDRTNAIFAGDEKLRDGLLQAGQKCGEPLWPMPLDPAYVYVYYVYVYAAKGES